MNVKDLINELEKFPEDAKVYCLSDGSPRIEINCIWMSRDGYMVFSDFDEVCYHTGARPKDAPDSESKPFWKSKKNA